MLEAHRLVITFALLGMLSGAISAVGTIPFIPSDNFRLLMIFFLPGLVFGLIVGPALAYGGWLRRTRIPAWIVRQPLVISPPLYA